MGRGDPASARRYCRYRCWAPPGPAAPTGREIAVRADERVNTLSIIKIPIMILAFQDAERGLLDLDERYTVRPENLRRGSGLIQMFAPGLAPTYRDIITQMIITSDNTATDIMIARLGDDVLAFEGDPEEWLGRTTAREMSKLLESIVNGEVASRESCDEMLAILGRQFDSTRLPRHIRFRARVAHKTGDWPPIAGNDAGIIYRESGPIVVAVFATENRGDF